MNNEARKAAIVATLTQAFDAITIEVKDDSGLHEGHKGAGGKGHFSVYIVSPDFTDKTRVARHRMIYAALESLLETDVHALAITAKTPTEVDNA